ncbi:MAG: putative ABC transporter permease subunit [Gemmatimonadales bacterium]
MKPRVHPSVWTVLTPKWRSAFARLREEQSGSGARAILLGLVALVFWGGVFGIAYRVLRYFRGVEDIGNLIAAKVLGIILLAFLSILLLSNIITALSTFFLAKDLDLLVAAPISQSRLYAAKLVETLVHSSWMVALLALPIFTAYGIVYGGGFLFPIVALAAFVPYLVLPAVVGTAFTLILVNVFPARRTRELLGLVATGAMVVVLMILRFLRPERLAQPEGFRNLVDYLAVLRTPTSPLLPSEWTASIIMNGLLRVADPWPIAKLWLAAPLAVFLGALLHRRLYHLGFSKAQEGAERKLRRVIRGPVAGILSPVSPSKREFILKDLRLFFRDNTQWSQLILLAVLLLVYLFNIKSLPLHSGEQVPFRLITMISFLNLGLAGFVLAAVAARFVFPGISLEGRQMWLLRSSPLDPSAMLWSKYWIGTIPLLVLALMITVFTNWLLHASTFMMAVAVGTIVLYTLAASALALSFGAIYPQFGSENAAQIPTSFGGLVYMMSTLSLLTAIIMIEATPVMAYLRMDRYGGQLQAIVPELAASAILIIGICLTATFVPLRMALQRIEMMEW